MIDRTVTVAVEADQCVGCEACLRLCPSDTLSMVGEKAAVTGTQSLNCGHCEAVCPTAAIRVAALDNAVLDFETFRHGPEWMPPGSFPLGELVRLMRSRRSCRNFRRKAVPRSLLRDLVRIGQTAPSGSNCQAWTFTVLPSREAVMRLTAAIGDYFLRLNRLAGNRLLRWALKCLGRPELDFYYRNYAQAIGDGIEAYRRTGEDRLFHGAPALILVGARAGAACPAEDALLATQNMLLGAHAMGLGTCLIGFAVAAFQREAALKKMLRIPRDETVYAAIALGFADEAYVRLPGRKAAPVRFWEGD